MTEDDYSVLARTRPELRLPSWWRIAPHFREHLLTKSIEELVAGRTYTLLSRKDWDTPELGADGIRVTKTLADHGFGYKEI